MTTTATPHTDAAPTGDAEDLTGLTVVEGPTAEAALTELHRQLGPTAQVVEVRKAHRGGIGGFFAREVVQIHARGGDAVTTPTGGARPEVAPAAASRPGAATAAASQPGAATAAASRPGAATAAGVAHTAAWAGGHVQVPARHAPQAPPADEVAGPTSPVDRLLGADADGIVDFATYLRGQFGGNGATSSDATATEPRGDQRDHEARLALLERATAAARAATAGPTGGGVVDPRTGAVATAAEPTVTDGATPASAPAADTAPLAQPDVAAPPVAEASSADAVAATATEDATTGDRLDVEPVASSEPGPAWSVAALIKLGLPAGLVRELDVAAPHDDVAWTAALAGALRSVCRPLPAGPSLLIGPRARSLATATGVTLTSVHQPIRSRAKVVAAAVGASTAARSWVERTRGNRWLHVVVGGKDWRSLLHLDPLAVSWAGPEELPETVRLAVELGLVLGSGPLHGSVGRARPLDVALALRDQLPVRR